MYPVAVAMAFELATYALVAGLLYERSRWQCVKALYKCIIIAMLAGRAVWGVAMLILLGIKGNQFTFQAFLSGAFINAIPGIVIQLILIPVIMVALDRAKLVPFRREKNAVKRCARRYHAYERAERSWRYGRQNGNKGHSIRNIVPGGRTSARQRQNDHRYRRKVRIGQNNRCQSTGKRNE